MESFKVYVPSNASADRFPQNTASDFKVDLSNPIELKDNWEVGVESIFYNSNIGDANEKARFVLDSMIEEEVDVNDLFPFKFKVSTDNKWLGYSGVKPSSIVRS